AARRFVLIVDDSKMVARLGTRAPVLVEALAFAEPFVTRSLQDLRPRIRSQDGRSFISDNGNPVLELHTGPIEDPAALARRLDGTPGVIDHGLFLAMAHAAYVASAAGVERIER